MSAPEGSEVALLWWLREQAARQDCKQWILDDLKRFTLIVEKQTLADYQCARTALSFLRVADLVEWIRADDDRVRWAWSHKDYREILEHYAG